MPFVLALSHLREVVRQRIRDGEFSERGLARALRLSQSHVHNLLKGARGLTPQVADALLAYLELTIEDLILGAGQAAPRKSPGKVTVYRAGDDRAASR